MGRVEADARTKVAATRWLRLRHLDWLLALRRVLFVLFLVDVAAAESELSILAKSGDGANRTHASSSLVTLLVLASLGVALLLRWQSVRAGILAAGRWLAHLSPALRNAPHGWRAGGHPSHSSHPSHPRQHARSVALQSILDHWRVALHATTLRHWVAVTLAGAALLSALIASALAGGPVHVLVAQWYWLAGIGLLVVAACVWPSSHPSPLHRLRWRLSIEANAYHTPRWRILWNRWGDWLLLAPLLGAGLALRLPNLASMPYVVHGDEASCALEALRWLRGDVHTLFSTGWYGLPVAGYGIPALVMRFAGDDLFGLRLSSVLVGLLSLALFYLLAREFAGRRVAFVATALLTVSHLHIQFSRSGIHYIHALFAVELTLWLLVRALRRQSAPSAVLAAIAMSLCVQVYFSARLVFVIAPLFVVGLLLLNRRLLAGRSGVFGWLVAGMLVAMGPLAVYFTTNSGALNSRTNEVLILNQTPWMHDHLIGQFGTADLPTVVLRQLAVIPLLPVGIADQSTQYGPHYSLLDVGVATLVTIGFFYALLRLHQPAYLLLSIWIAGTVVLGGILTIDMPDWQRLLVMLPAIYLLAALVLEDMLRHFEHSVGALGERLPTMRLPRLQQLPHLPTLAPTLAATLLALTLVGMSASWNIQRYYVDFPHQTNGDPWWTTYSDIGRYLGTLPAGTRFILFSDGDLVADYATLRYLGPGATGTRVETTADLALALTKTAGPTVTIVTLSHVADVEVALLTNKTLPPGMLTPYITANHTTTFYLFTPAEPSPGEVTDTR